MEARLARHEVKLLSSRRAPAMARELVSQWLDGNPRLEDILLATSELVTNVVRHAHSAEGMSLIVQTDGPRVRVEVVQPGDPFTDRSADLPPTDLTGGLGLPIVRAVADQFGIEGHGPVMVWFEVLDREAESDAALRAGRNL
jgi:anti-sigma regulatory factor (Ser/Thr protein kinase)